MQTHPFYLWVLHCFYSAVEGRAQGSKADQHVHLRMLLHSVCHVFINWDQDLFMAPVKLLLVIPTENIQTEELTKEQTQDPQTLFFSYRLTYVNG